MGGELLDRRPAGPFTIYRIIADPGRSGITHNGKTQSTVYDIIFHNGGGSGVDADGGRAVGGQHVVFNDRIGGEKENGGFALIRNGISDNRGGAVFCGDSSGLVIFDFIFIYKGFLEFFR